MSGVITSVEYSLGFIIHEGRILLGMRETGIGKGCWSGLGGHVEPDETSLECLIREFEEESGIIVREAEHVASLRAIRHTEDEVALVDIFIVTKTDSNKAFPSDEISEFQWFSLNALPYSQMIDDSRHWLPDLLQQHDGFLSITFETKPDGVVTSITYSHPQA